MKSIVLANQWLINNYFYVLLVKNGTFEVTYQCFTYCISISLLVFEYDQLTIFGCFGRLALYLLQSRLYSVHAARLRRSGKPTALPQRPHSALSNTLCKRAAMQWQLFAMIGTGR